VLRPGPAMPPSADAPVVRMVQSGATQREKWRPANLQRFIDLHMAFTSAGEPVDLTIWSETALPYVLDDAGPELALAAEAARGGSVILGAQRREGADWFNSLALVGPEGLLQAVYDKVHLVPYGEYLPFDSLMTRLGLAGLAANPGGGFTAGSERKLIDVPGVGAIMPLICYESVFPAEVATMTERPRAIVLITNDAWFGRFSGPYQHLAQGRARAIELAVPMVRVAQTGVSAVIDGRGRIVASIPLGEAGFLDVALPDELAPTLYAIRGDLPALIGLVLVALSAIGLSLKAIDRGRGAA
ncbi:MAG: apolipoprotein N-acyltransferase, partial [Marivita sp.]|uniref:apolipoprotein N-acyltransferase n=1 Tax=Marivita sp. TaxID=2003365 RepID=UPI003EF726AD